MLIQPTQKARAVESPEEREAQPINAVRDRQAKLAPQPRALLEYNLYQIEFREPNKI
jgi:hypothetical protein